MSTRDTKSRTKTKILNGALLVAVAGAGFGGYSVLHASGTSSSVTRTSATVTRGVVSQTVSASGNVAAISSVELNFDSGVSSNLVSEIAVKVGDKVKKGQVLAKVDDRVLQNNLVAAQASLVAAQANYNKTKAGLTPEERVQVDSSDTQAAIQLANAQTALDNALTTQTLNVTTSTESVRQATNNLANVQAQADRDLSTPQANYNTAKANHDGPKATRDAAAALVATLTADAQFCVDNAGASNAPDGQSCATVANDLAVAESSLTAAENALTPLQTALDTATNALDAQKLKSKTSVDSATNSVINAQNNQTSTATKDAQSVLSAQRSLESQQASYDSTIAANATKRKSPTAADMAAQEVSLTNAKNSLFTAQKNATNATLLATADGTIGAMNGRVAYAGSNTSGTGTTTGTGGSSNAFVTITDLSAYEVKVGFGEADAAKVKAGQTATISLDALSGARLTATVRSVDTVSTLVSNVVTYYAYLTVTQTNGVAVGPVRNSVFLA